jgi:hypothetical protein
MNYGKPCELSALHCPSLHLPIHVHLRKGLKGSKSLQIHCCAAPKENTKLPKALSYGLEEATQPTTHAEMDRAVAVIMARISGSEGLGD